MKKQYSAPPAMQIDQTKNYVAVFDTNKGTFEIQLFADRAPIAVNNFVFLAREGFYDGLKFHRVVPNFVIQGGDPTGNGTGGPGYQWADDPGGLKIKHDSAGILSMAHKGAGTNSNGSQFFVTHRATPHLDGIHAVFGKVIGDGQQVVDAIQQGDVMNTVTIKES